MKIAKDLKVYKVKKDLADRIFDNEVRNIAKDGDAMLKRQKYKP